MKSLQSREVFGQKVTTLASYGAAAVATVALLKYSWHSYKKSQTRAKGRRLYEAKMSKTYEFKAVENEQLILSLDLTGLREHLLKGTFTSVDLVNVFGKRCYTIGRRLNLTAEENFEEAFQQAQERDEERRLAIEKGTATNLPSFHGIPVSIKELVRTLFPFSFILSFNLLNKISIRQHRRGRFHL